MLANSLLFPRLRRAAAEFSLPWLILKAVAYKGQKKKKNAHLDVFSGVFPLYLPSPSPHPRRRGERSRLFIQQTCPGCKVVLLLHGQGRRQTGRESQPQRHSQPRWEGKGRCKTVSPRQREQGRGLPDGAEDHSAAP